MVLSHLLWRSDGLHSPVPFAAIAKEHRVTLLGKEQRDSTVPNAHKREVFKGHYEVEVTPAKLWGRRSRGILLEMRCALCGSSVSSGTSV